ncbi:MAG: hypothetical protein HKN91_01110 [Acidimicrobiia bacterium]|nr:hypothetical protein [Acidimicrobiia bacterium]
MKRTLLFAVALALITSACAADSEEPGTTTTTSVPGTGAPPANGDDVLLIIRDEGGFAPIEFIINQPPTYTLLRDGTFIFQGTQPAAFPGPVMPGMSQTKLTADQMEDIMVLIEASTLPEIDEVVNNEANQFVADASTTVAIYFDENGQTHTYSVYALGLTLDDELPDDLANLLLLRQRLADFSFGDGEPYTSDSIIVRVVEGGGFAEFEDTREWAFGFEPDTMPTLNNFPCLVLEGADADELRATLVDATQATNWEHATGMFTVLARDMMPGESGCDQQ